jgi:hypothetical protein
MTVQSFHKRSCFFAVSRCPYQLHEQCTGEAPLRGRRRAGAHPPDQSTAVPVGVPAQGRGGAPDSQPVPAGDQADQVRACAAVALLCMCRWTMTRLYFAASSLVSDATARGGLANVARSLTSTCVPTYSDIVLTWDALLPRVERRRRGTVMTNKSSPCSSTESRWRQDAAISRLRHRPRYGYLRY